MPKRSCPFDSNHEPQLKLHVTEKVAIECKENGMESIWSKTQKLLMKGGKKQCETNVNLKNDDIACDYCLNVYVSEVLSCILCKGYFCSNCSTSIYQDDITESVCLSCAK